MKSAPEATKEGKESTKDVLKHKKDKFALYLAILTMVILIGAGGAIYAYMSGKSKKDKSESYFTLPQMDFNILDKQVRLILTIQVNVKDQSWLEDNKRKIALLAQEAANHCNPADFRSKKGLEKIQLAIKNELNEKMQTTKIQAVWYGEVLVKTKDNE